MAILSKIAPLNTVVFDVHNDETTPHIHIQTVPVAKTKTRGRASVKYVHKDDKTKMLSQKEWKKLSEDARRDYVRTEMSQSTHRNHPRPSRSAACRKTARPSP